MCHLVVCHLPLSGIYIYIYITYTVGVTSESTRQAYHTRRIKWFWVATVFKKVKHFHGRDHKKIKDNKHDGVTSYFRGTSLQFTRPMVDSCTLVTVYQSKLLLVWSHRHPHVEPTCRNTLAHKHTGIFAYGKRSCARSLDGTTAGSWQARASQ